MTSTKIEDPLELTPSAVWNKDYKLRHPEQVRISRKEYYSFRNQDPKWIAHWKEMQARTRNRRRLDVLTAYGGKCACCGYSDMTKIIHGHTYLQIDHINGNGQEHRREVGSRTLYLWLKQNQYPSGFRVLCAACNIAMEPGGVICECHKFQHSGEIKPE